MERNGIVCAGMIIAKSGKNSMAGALCFRLAFNVNHPAQGCRDFVWGIEFGLWKF